MTKAEAIERLENDCCKSRVYCELYPDACQKEECEIYMAIEALKERPTGKWIDRSDGGRILYPWWETCECSQCGEYGSGAYDFCPNCGSYNGGEK